MKNVLKGFLLASCLVQPAQAQMGHVLSKDQSQQHSQQRVQIVQQFLQGDDAPPQQIQIIQPLQEYGEDNTHQRQIIQPLQEYGEDEDLEESEHPQNQANRQTNSDGEENRIQEIQEACSNGLLGFLLCLRHHQEATRNTQHIVLTFEDPHERREDQRTFYLIDLTDLSQHYLQQRLFTLHFPLPLPTEEEDTDDDISYLNPMGLHHPQQLALPSVRNMGTLEENRERPQHISLLVQPNQQVQQPDILHMQQQPPENQQGVLQGLINRVLSNSKL